MYCGFYATDSGLVSPEDFSKGSSLAVMMEGKLTSHEMEGDLEQVESKTEVPLEEQVEDPYFYTRTQDFTSEIYKIEINGLPAMFGFGQLKKLLNNKLKLKCHKIKGYGNKAPFAFVTFRCEADRETALTKLKGFKWKGKVLNAKRANPSADPIVKKQKQMEHQEEGLEVAAKKQKLAESTDDMSVTDRMKQAVSPLWQVPYDQQLKKKEREMRHMMLALGKKLETAVGDCAWFQDHKAKYNGLCCELLPIRSSPVTEGYRNKCEFSIGTGSDGLPTVGFRLSRYVDGCVTVAEVDDCDIVPSEMKKVTKVFQQYIRESDKTPFDPKHNTGFWRQLTVRTTRNKDILVIVVMHPQSLSEDELKNIQEDLVKYFSDGPGSHCGVTSLYFQLFAKRESGKELVCNHLFGEKYIYESLMGMKFRISPDAFFQTNTAATEVLYSMVADFAAAESSTAALDVCCGTGTIGLTLAKSVSSVLGIEMVAGAIEDAKYNAEANGLQQVEFACGKAEDVISRHLGPLSQSHNNIVAVVDPPRAGLHNKVIRTLRWCREIKRLVYVSCDPKGATTNFIDLCRLPSNQYNSDPFVPVKAVPVDLFPHTSHCELVIVFERLPSQQPGPANESQT